MKQRLPQNLYHSLGSKYNNVNKKFFSVWAESFFKVRFLETYFYNSRSGKSFLSFYNFGIGITREHWKAH